MRETLKIKMQPTLSTCFTQATTKVLANQSWFSLKHIDNQTWMDLIEALQRSQNDNTIQGIAYQIGQIFFYAYLYAYDKQLKFSELSFKLQPFEQKKQSFFSSFVQMAQAENINCTWHATDDQLQIITTSQFENVVEWFFKGFLNECLFWLSNGKKKLIKVTHSTENQTTKYLISIR